MSSRSTAPARSPSLFRKLNPGPGRSSDQVVADQRKRIEAATVELAAEYGYPALTVRSLSSAAGISTRTFYEHFSNVEDCFSSTYEALMHCALRNAASSSRWALGGERGVRAALRSIARDIAARPTAAQVVLVESYAVGPGIQTRMDASISGFEALLSEGLTFEDRAPEAASCLVRGMAAGVLRVMRAALLADRLGDLPILTEELGDWIASFKDAPIGDLIEPRSSRWSSGFRQRRRSPGPPAGSAMGVSQRERARILASTIKLATSGGYAALTIPRIRAEAGVSRRSIDTNFSDVQDCFLWMVESLASAAASSASRAAAESICWEERIYKTIQAACADISHNQGAAHLGLVEILAPGKEGLTCREQLMTKAATSLRRTAPPKSSPTATSAEAAIAAAWQIVQTEVTSKRASVLPRMVPLLAQVMLAPVAQYK